MREGLEQDSDTIRFILCKQHAGCGVGNGLEAGRNWGMVVTQVQDGGGLKENKSQEGGKKQPDLWGCLAVIDTVVGGL